MTYFTSGADGLRVEGTTAGLQDGETWVVHYRLQLDDSWTTRRAWINEWAGSSMDELVIEADGAGHWSVGGKDATHLEGCLDVDLESSAMTNALPIHRLSLAVGERATAPAAYVRILGQRTERLDQLYARVEDSEFGQQYDYEAPAFDFTCRLVYDDCGLVLDYPGIARRAG